MYMYMYMYQFTGNNLFYSQMVQNPQLLLAQQNVARVCKNGLETVQSIIHDLMNPVEVPILSSDSVSVLLLLHDYNHL